MCPKNESLFCIVFIVDGAWPLFTDVLGHHNIYSKCTRIENELSGTCSMDAIEICETCELWNRNRLNCESNLFYGAMELLM